MTLTATVISKFSDDFEIHRRERRIDTLRKA
jgi:hypothetical protein